MDDTEAPGQLSDDEVEQFRRLLKRYCSHELDQWENWQVETSYGPAYVTLSRAPLPGVSPDAYQQL